MRRYAFTIIEVLVVIAIIAVLLGMLIPAVQMIRSAASKTECANNMRQIGLATLNFEQQFGVLPGCIPDPASSLPGATPLPPFGGPLVRLLPYLEENGEWDYNRPFVYDMANPSVNRVGRTLDPRVLRCPSDPSNGRQTVGGEQWGRTNYYANVGAQANTRLSEGRGAGAFYNDWVYGRGVKLGDFVDGVSKTALFAEVKRGGDLAYPELVVYPVPAASWTSDYDQPLTCSNASFAPPGFDYTGLQYWGATAMWHGYYTHTAPINYERFDCVRANEWTRGHIAARSYHKGGVSVVRADGSAVFISSSIDMKVWTAFGTRAGLRDNNEAGIPDAE